MGARKHIHSIEGANHREWKLQQETETRLLHQKVLLHVLTHPWGNVSDASLFVSGDILMHLFNVDALSITS